MGDLVLFQCSKRSDRVREVLRAVDAACRRKGGGVECAWPWPMTTCFLAHTYTCGFFTGSGQIEFEEFCELLMRHMEDGEGAGDDSMLEAFRTFDKDGSGTISAEELKQVRGGGGWWWETRSSAEILWVQLVVGNKKQCRDTVGAAGGGKQEAVQKHCGCGQWWETRSSAKTLWVQQVVGNKKQCRDTVGVGNGRETRSSAETLWVWAMVGNKKPCKDTVGVAGGGKQEAVQKHCGCRQWWETRSSAEILWVQLVVGNKKQCRDTVGATSPWSKFGEHNPHVENEERDPQMLTSPKPWTCICQKICCVQPVGTSHNKIYGMQS